MSENQLNREHKFLARSPLLPLIAETNKVSTYVINHLAKSNYSISKLKKLGKMKFEWTDNKGINHAPILSIDAISDHIRLRRSLNTQELELKNIECLWLDGLTSIAKPDAPIQTSDGSKYLKFELEMPYGKEFPLKPCIDREGAAYKSLQTPLQTNIIRLFNSLIDNSHIVVRLDGIWLNDLRMLINDCISIVDVTLHQLYYMAKYQNIKMGWKFDEDKLGPKGNIRMSDKFSWINKITGRPLDNVQSEMRSFMSIKALRNHINHFDPPCFAYTVEDVVKWLNRVSDIGRLLWRIREKLGAQLNQKIIEIIFLPKVIFVPRDSSMPRIEQLDKVGYKSTVLD